MTASWRSALRRAARVVKVALCAVYNPVCEARITFTNDPWHRRQVAAELRNCRVVLDETHPLAKDVQPGETWHVRIRDRFLYFIAEPIQRIQAPETDEKT